MSRRKTSEQLAQQTAQQKQLKAFKAATARVRGRKSERGKVILVNTKGQRVEKGYRGKVFAGYVTKKSGKIKWVKERGVPKLQRPRSFRIEKFSGRSGKGAARKKLVSSTLGRVEKTVSLARGEHSVDWGRVASAGADALLQTAKAEKGFARTIIATVAATVRLPGGDVKVFPAPPANSFTIHLANGQSLSGQQAEDQFSGKAYAIMAQALKNAGLVSAGSASFIANLPENEDVDDDDLDDLVNSRGAKWNSNRQVCDILSVDIITEQIAQ